MAAGLVALGAGVLAASLLPPTPAEQRAARRVRDGLGPLQQRAGEAGRELAEGVGQSAQERMEEVKSRANEAVQQVKDETTSSTEEVKTETKSASRRVKGEAKAGAQRVKSDNGRASGSSSASSKPAPRRRPVRAR